MAFCFLLLRRSAMSQDSLFRIPPTPAEQALIHQFFVKSIDLKVAFPVKWEILYM
jgi:hypothetical protein